MSIEISIIIPCYNGMHYLPSLAENLRRVVENNVEVIFVDDGSTDGSISKFTELLPQARCFSQENQGLGATRNRAVREAAGEYLQLLDADDTLQPGKLRTQLEYAREHNLDVVYSNWRMVIHTEAETRHEAFVGASYSGDIVTGLLSGWWFPPCAALVRKTSFERVGGCDARLGNTCEDFDLWVRLAIDGAHFGYCPGDFSNYHRYEYKRSMSRLNRREFFEGEAHIIENALSLLSKQGRLSTDYKNAAAKRMHGVARNAILFDKVWYDQLRKRIYNLSPAFEPNGSPLYRVLARLFGIGPIDRLSAGKNRLNRLLKRKA